MIFGLQKASNIYKLKVKQGVGANWLAKHLPENTTAIYQCTENSKAAEG